jgi:succinyl-diaminopimelate desuccinylase
MSHAPGPLEILEHLVALDSQNPGPMEAAVAGFVADVARSFGFRTRVIEPAAGRCNVIASVDAGPGPSLGLSGHLDTKPIGDALPQWRTPPCELVIEDGWAYGLGAADMKGAVAALLCGARDWAASATRGRLELIFTADEEAGSRYGAYALCERGEIDCDAILIGEPSGVAHPWEALYLASRGSWRFEIVISGTQGHSGLSEMLPTSATVAAALAICALTALRPEAGADRFAQYVTVNPAVRMEGGVGYGIHPGSATVRCEIRTTPGMRRDVLEREVTELLEAALPEDVTWCVRDNEDVPWRPAVSIAEDHPLVAAAQAACAEVLGGTLPYRPYPGGTDAIPFVLEAGIPTVSALGPGRLSDAHGPNERVRVRDVELAVDLYRALAGRYCDALGTPDAPDRRGHDPRAAQL